MYSVDCAKSLRMYKTCTTSFESAQVDIINLILRDSPSQNLLRRGAVRVILFALTIKWHPLR